MYVRQKVATLQPGTHRSETFDSVPHAADSLSHTPTGTVRVLSDETVLGSDAPTRILVAGAGGGKSTLLRRQLADAAGHWLPHHRPARAGVAVPVLIRATTLAAGPVLPVALATAVTEELGPFGLREPLTADIFSHRPFAHVPWLVMVDGLDEIPQRNDRIALLERLALAAEQQPGVYRFVVTTRPLPVAELSHLGPATAYSELRPFTRSDLRAYARGRFASLPDVKIHINEFMTGLKLSGLEALARTPLIASILCRLYLADPTRPLPEGRTATYRSFVELLYEQNAHKDIRRTHDAAIRALKDQYQIPRDNLAAERAAQGVRDHLPELIDRLAHERINGNTASATEILVSHVPARRPDRVTKSRWQSFLGDLLRPTGLVVQRGDDFVFLHQTLLEFHAARYATRDRQARTELFHEVFPHHRDPVAADAKPPSVEASYLGFLLDGLLEGGDHIATATTWALERLGAHTSTAACRFLTEQTHLRTRLPRATAGHLADFAADTTRDMWDRVYAAWALSRLEGHQDQSAGLLAAFAAETIRYGGVYQVKAAGLLARLDGHRDEAAVLLSAFPTDTALSIDDRVYAAWALAQLDEHTADAVTFLVSFVTDTTLGRDHRVRALTDLSGVEGHTDRVAKAFLAFARDPTLRMEDRVRAAAHLAQLDGHAQDAVGVLTACAMDTTLKAADRMEAAAQLTRLDGHAHDAAGLLVAFAADTTLTVWDRVHAAGYLARLDAHAEDAISLLIAFATNTELEVWDRLEAALTLIRRTADKRATELFTALATDSTLDSIDRMEAIKYLAKLNLHKRLASDLYATLAADTTLSGTSRVLAAVSLADLGRNKAQAVQLLTALSTDTELSDGVRRFASRVLFSLRVTR